MDLATLTEIGTGAGGMGGTVLILLAIAKKYGLISIQKPNSNGQPYNIEKCLALHKVIDEKLNSGESHFKSIDENISAINTNVAVLLDRSNKQRQTD